MLFNKVLYREAAPGRGGGGSRGEAISPKNFFGSSGLSLSKNKGGGGCGGEPGSLPWIRHCSKEILDSRILDCSLWILDSGFLELNSRFQSPGLWIPEAKISRIYMGRQESDLIINWFCI